MWKLSSQKLKKTYDQFLEISCTLEFVLANGTQGSTRDLLHGTILGYVNIYIKSHKKQNMEQQLS
jgi:hypothetical protein